jgi:hypothetical protein
MKTTKTSPKPRAAAKRKPAKGSVSLSQMGQMMPGMASKPKC